MRTKKILMALVTFALLPLGAYGQEEDDKTYVYATYFHCDVTAQDEADAIVKDTWAPIYNTAVKDGTIKDWGWMAHHTGGKWRRLQYYTAPSIDALLDGQDKIGEKIDAAGGDADDRFGKICNSHVDYIWEYVAGSGLDERGNAGMSVYHVCDMAREETVDEMVEKMYAPVYDKFVADGKITSWGWLTHVVGGKYRRLSTMTAVDFKTLIKARGEIFEEMDKRLAGNEFSDICPSHSDYLWEIQH